jgi:homoserine O-succinyltransferase/O-acetyltransferase
VTGPLPDPAGTPRPPGLAPASAGCDRLVIGLVNNMPDAALHNTERQFRRLLGAAASETPVCLRLFYFAEIPRSERGRAHLEQHYEEAGALWSDRLDGLIVTGTEPRAADLRDEPYWAVLTRLVGWAEDRTVSTIWSCLAAHAAVLYEDGIARQKLPEKLSGVFECRKIADHPIVRGTPPRWRVAHSRYNGVPEAALAARGYRLLTRAKETGPDLFVRQRRSLFVYFQGHPEYEPDTLAREYRRDVGRFLAGERDDYPEMPRGYFDREAAAALALLRQRALADRNPELLAKYPAVALIGSAGASSPSAVTIYRRWLSYVAAGKDRGDGAPFSAGSRRSDIGAPIADR